MQTVSWVVLALIHATPAAALFQPGLLTRLYGVEPSSQLFLLLHHRAALFLAVVAACLWAIFDPGAPRVAVIVVGVSMISFLVLYWMAGSPSAVHTIAFADLIGMPFLAYLAWCTFLAPAR